MARIYGTSRVWGEIKLQLEELKLNANHPREFDAMLEACYLEYEQQLRRALQVLDAEIQQLEQEVKQEREAVTASLSAFSEESALEIEQAEANLDLYKQDSSIFNFIRNAFRVRREARKINRLIDQSASHRSSLETPLQTREALLEQKKQGKNDLARQSCQEIIARIEFLKSISGSQDLATAVAELDLQELLSQLPINCHVYNNVNLQVERGFLFEGQWLIKAQIDNLVVTPSGIFAIQVKSWSKQSGENGANPYDAIKQASQLCYELVKHDFPEITVRSVLAYRGHLPEDQNPGLVKALPIQDVPAYIRWFTDNTLTSVALLQLLNRIQEIKTN